MRIREIRAHIGKHVELTTFNARFVGSIYNVGHDDATGNDRVDLAECFQIRSRGKSEYFQRKSLVASTISEVRPL